MTPLQRREDEVFTRIGCAVLKVGYKPELLSVAILLPATEDELAVVVQAARGQELRRLFPRIQAILPQPSNGTAVYIATPSWSADQHAVCFSTLGIDGRVFAAHAPDYAARHELLWIARLDHTANVDIYVGTAEQPLLDEFPVHLFPAGLVSFVPRDSPVPSCVPSGNVCFLRLGGHMSHLFPLCKMQMRTVWSSLERLSALLSTRAYQV